MIHQRLFLIAIPALVLMALAALAVFWTQKPPSPPEPLVIAVGKPLSMPFLIAEQQGFFAAEGLHVTLRHYPFGRLALEAMLRGEAEVAAVAETPIVFATLEKQPFSIIAQYMTSGEHSLVARADRGIRQITDLRGRRVGVSISTTAHYFLHVLLSDHGLTDADIEQVSLPAPEQPAALAEGRVDAVAAFTPFSFECRRVLGDAAVSFTPGIRYTGFSALTVPRDFPQRRPEAALRLLRAIDRAILWMRNHRREAIDFVARELDMDSAALEESWSELHPALALDQAALLLLETEARWALEAGLAPGAGLPNYFEYFDTSVLDRLRPEVVTVVKPQ